MKGKEKKMEEENDGVKERQSNDTKIMCTAFSRCLNKRNAQPPVLSD